MCSFCCLHVFVNSPSFLVLAFHLFIWREQTLLEEEEIPWLQYREEIDSSSDEENYPFSDFLHPIFFLLDGNNNFEDDSSVSEDLDVEWRYAFDSFLH